jgi:drug/metabolite transporter (DMT)-like permease
MIAGILTFIFSGIVFFISILAFLGVNFININLGFPWEFFGGIGLLLTLISFVFGFLYVKASKMMLSKKSSQTGSIMAIVLGVITLGNIIGILGLVGGIIGLIESS